MQLESDEKQLLAGLAEPVDYNSIAVSFKFKLCRVLARTSIKLSACIRAGDKKEELLTGSL